MTKQKFRPTYGWSLTKNDKEKPTGPSLTIVDETYTIKELVIRAQQGFYPVQAKQAIWAPEEDIDAIDLEKLTKMDLAEKEVILEQTRERVHKLQEEVKTKKSLIAEMQQKHAAQTEEIMLEKLASRKQQETDTKKVS